MKSPGEPLGQEGRKVLGFVLLVGAASAALLVALAQPAPASAPPAPTAEASAASAEPRVAASEPGIESGQALASYDELPPSLLSETGAEWSDLVGLVVKLGLVLVLMVLGLRGLQRLSGRTGGPLVGGKRSVEVLESTSLGQGMGVFLVGVGQRVLLVGGTNQQVALLAEIDDPSILSQRQPARPVMGDFDHLLSEAQQGRFPSASR